MSDRGFDEQSTIRLVRQVVDLIEARNISVWAEYGTLLGLVREGRLLAGDSDVDLGVSAPEFVLSWPEIRPELERQGFACHLRLSAVQLKPPGDGVLPIYLHLYWPLDDDRIAHAVPGLRIKRFWRRADMTRRPWVYRSPRILRLAAGSRTARAVMGARYLRTFDVLPVSEYLLGHHRIPMPRRPEAVLRTIYGDRWRVPTEDFQYRNFVPPTLTARGIRSRQREGGDGTRATSDP